ncbi:MAG: ATP-dependent zinc protease [Pseudomonadota bacterium]
MCGPITLGWREWVSLPDIGLWQLKAKVDTGARTSALHAFDVTTFSEGGEPWVRFLMHPNQRDDTSVTECLAPILDERDVRDSGGHQTRRFVIKTELVLGPHRWPIEATLTARDDMLFRMLLGRTALHRRCLVDPSRSYLVGERPGVAAQDAGAHEAPGNFDTRSSRADDAT